MHLKSILNKNNCWRPRNVSTQVYLTIMSLFIPGGYWWVTAQEYLLRAYRAKHAGHFLTKVRGQVKNNTVSTMINWTRA